MTSMNAYLPSRITNPLDDVRAVQVNVQAQRQQFARDAEARQVMDVMGVYDQRFRKADTGQYERDLNELNVRIAQSNLTRGQLIAGVRRAYSGADTPWNPIGAVLAEAKAARQSASRGSVVREMRALPAAPPSTGPVWGAYAECAGIECPTCSAPAGEPCINAVTSKPKRIPCLTRKVESSKESPQQ